MRALRGQLTADRSSSIRPGRLPETAAGVAAGSAADYDPQPSLDGSAARVVLETVDF